LTTTTPLIESMGLTNIIEPLSLDGDQYVNWMEWRKEFEIYMLAHGYHCFEELRKVSILLFLIGKPARAIFDTFDIDLYNVTMADLTEHFDKFFGTAGANVAKSRDAFFSRRQLPKECIDHFLEDLAQKSEDCRFGTLNDSIVKSVFVSGLNEEHSYLRDRLLSDNDLTTKRLRAWFFDERSCPLENDNEDSDALDGDEPALEQKKTASSTKKAPKRKAYTGKAKARKPAKKQKK